MIGGKGCKGTIIQDEDFFHRLAKEKSYDNVIDINQRKFIINIEMNTVDERGYGGDMSVDIKLMGLKLNVLPEVFLPMSAFFILALQRMDSAKRKFSKETAQEKRKMQIKAGSLSQMTTSIHLCDSLLILERPTRSEKSLVCDTELIVHMKGKAAPPDFETQIGASGQFQLSAMTVKLIKFIPYICKVGQLDQMPFKDCQKREIAPNIKIEVSMNTHIVEIVEGLKP